MSTMTAALLRLFIVVATMLVAHPGFAQKAYPNRTISLIVPYPPGGTTDPVARLLAQKLTADWGQSVVVYNRPGGNTIIGAQSLLAYPADGYTILLNSISHVIVPSLIPVPYDALKDFTPIGGVINMETILVVNPSLPVTNLSQLIQLAKAKPGKLNYASAGIGSIQHLAGAEFDINAGVQTRHIPYSGGGAALADLISGRVDMEFAAPPGVVQFIKSGKLRALAVTGNTPMDAPAVPTFAQGGLPSFEMDDWNGLFVRTGTPQPIIDKLAAELQHILALPDVQTQLALLGTKPLPMPPAQFSALLKSDMAKYAKLIKRANIKMTQ